MLKQLYNGVQLYFGTIFTIKKPFGLERHQTGNIDTSGIKNNDKTIALNFNYYSDQSFGESLRKLLSRDRQD